MVVFFTVEALLASAKVDRTIFIARVVCCVLTLVACGYLIKHEVKAVMAENEFEKREEEKDKKRLASSLKKTKLGMGGSSRSPSFSATQTKATAVDHVALFKFYSLKYLGYAVRWLPIMEFYEHVTQSVWNVIDFLSLSLVLATYVLRAVKIFDDAGFHDVSHITCALALPFLYLNFLKYMQGFENSGKLVSMVVGITKGIKDFTLILCLICLGFAFAFHVLYKSGPGIVDTVCGEDQVFTQSDALMAVLGSYTLMLGDFDVEEYTATSSLTTSIVLFVVFMFGVNIVLLNLLIAIMGDIYEQINENATQQFLFLKTNIILEFESIMPQKDKSDEKKFPPYLQILKAKSDEDDDDDDDDEWSGKLNAVKSEVRKNAEKLSEELKKVAEESAEELQKVNKMLESELKKSAEQIEALKEGMKAILAILKTRPQDQAEMDGEKLLEEDYLKEVMQGYDVEEEGPTEQGTPSIAGLEIPAKESMTQSANPTMTMDERLSLAKLSGKKKSRAAVSSLWET
jgi:hypothetical protein